MSEAKVLIYDTDERFVRRMTNMLQAEEYTVYSAKTLSDVLVILKRNKPDLTLIDMNVEEGGFEACELIKADKEVLYARILLIYGAGVDIPNLKKRAIESGATGSMAKLIPSEIFSAVEQQIGMSEDV